MRAIKEYKCVIHLSHIDADGYGCQWLVSKECTKHGVVYIPYNTNYGEEISVRLEAIEKILPKTEKTENPDVLVLVTDLNLLKSDYDNVIGMAKYVDVVMIDHHPCQPGVGLTPDEIDFIHNRGKSATMLTHDWLKEVSGVEYDDDDEFFTRCINAADIFTEKDTPYFQIGRYLASAIHEAADKIPRMYNKKHYAYMASVVTAVRNCIPLYRTDFDDVDDFLHTLDISITEELLYINLGKEKRVRYTRYKLLIEILAEAVSKLPLNVDRDDNRFIISTDIGPISDVADIVFDMRELDYIVNFNSSGGVSVRVSPYSECNAGEIAKSINPDGGGHMKAAGAYYVLKDSDYMRGVDSHLYDKIKNANNGENVKQKPIIVIITGPSCSGKTTVEKKLVSTGKVSPVTIVTSRERRSDDPRWVISSKDNPALPVDKECLFQMKVGNGDRYAYYAYKDRDCVVSFINGNAAKDFGDEVKKDYYIIYVNLIAPEDELKKCMKERGYDEKEIAVREASYIPLGIPVSREAAADNILDYLEHR